jgi:tetratricopeptide (TPR) repeat protein
MSAGGLILIVVLAFYWWHGRRMMARSRRIATPIDWYQAEFGCGPLAADATIASLLSAPVESSLSLQSTSEQPAPEQSTPEQPASEQPASEQSDLGKPQPILDDPSSHSSHKEAALTSQETTPPSLRDRYATFIDQIITDTLKGRIRSKDYVYDRLVEQLQPRTGEIFERCLVERMDMIQHQLGHETDELKQAKAGRQARALDTLQDAWQRWQQIQQAQAACSSAVAQLMGADGCDRLAILLQVLDPNQTYVLSHQRIELLAQELDQVQETDTDPVTFTELRSLSTGLKQGLLSYSVIESHLVSWLYEGAHKLVGFAAKDNVNNPWNYWAKHVARPLPQMLFAGQALNQSAIAVAQQQTTLDLSAWVELMVLLRGMQNGLVAWFDKQPYSFQLGRNLAAATFLAFAIIWCELSNGFHQAQQLLEADRLRLSRACFQITLQILRAFAQRDNFPLYGGIFASFSGESFRDTVAYLDKPLKAIEKSQEKARILTVLGYSQQWIGNRDRAKQLYQEALDLAQQAADQTCEIANLNHLSRLSLSQREFADAIAYGQRALLFARQIGDSLGEANAIANLGYAEVRQAQQREHVAAMELEDCIQRLERGLKLTEKHQDWMSGVFCYLGLGLAHLISNQSNMAKPLFEKGRDIATRMGDLELEGLSQAMIAEVNYQLGQFTEAVIPACLGTYLLEQKQAIEWRQVFNLAMILQGRLGDEAFRQILQQQRLQLITKIGVDGFDHVLNLLKRS